MKSILIAAFAVVLTLAVALAVRMNFSRQGPAGGFVIADSSEKGRAPTQANQQYWTCSMHTQVIQDHPGLCPICHMKLVRLNIDTGGDDVDRTSEESAGPMVRVDPAIVQNMGIRTAEVSRGSISKTVRAVGMLEVPDDASYEINLKVGGWIQKLYANQEGMHVQKDRVLFDLYSPDVQVAAEELIGAVKSLGAVDLKSPESLRFQGQQLVDSARQKLHLWGLADEDINAIAQADKAPGTVPFRSPVAGDVAEKMVVEGSAVQPGMKIMRIEDHTTLWLNVSIYEDEMALIAIGQGGQITFAAWPGKSYTGVIAFIHPHVDQASRTVMARIVLHNPDHELSPGMYATANIITTGISGGVWVPREAVIDTGVQQIAFVVRAEGHFEPRKVQMGLLGDDDRVQILQGLKPGEIVVTSGQFLLDVESRTTEAIDKLKQGGKGPDLPGAGSGPTTRAAAGMLNSGGPALR